MEFRPLVRLHICALTQQELANKLHDLQKQYTDLHAGKEIRLEVFPTERGYEAKIQSCGVFQIMKTLSRSDDFKSLLKVTFFIKHQN
jgi:hypothetical protein